MNKLMIFPMGFMFILTAFSIISTGTHPTTDYTYTSSGGGGTTTTDEFDIWMIGVGAGVVLIAALAAAIIMGFNLFGSGFNETSQTMTFDAILYGGLWAGLSVVAASFLFDEMIISLFWIILTFIYVLGLGMEMSGNTS
jgi:hypothetical protein